MTITERLALIIDADGRGAIRELNKVGDTADREIGRAETSLDKWGKRMTSVGATMMAGSAVVGVALWNAAGATSDLAEAADYSGRVFGEASDQISEFAESAEDIGLSERAAHEAATTFADLLKATGATKGELAGMSIEMTQLAADMASAKNTSPEEAIEALGAALRGESEPIRRYGVMLDDATLKQRALDMGLVETTKGTLPIAIKMQAAYSEILAQTAGMQGNFADTSDSAANKQRIMAAEIENAKASIGEGFLPVMSSTVGVLSGAADRFGELNDASNGLAGNLLGVGTVALGAGGALAFGVGKAIEMRDAFRDLQQSGSRVGRELATVGSFAAPIAAAAIALDQLAKAANDGRFGDSDMSALDRQLRALGQGTKLRSTTEDIEGLAEAISTADDAAKRDGLSRWGNNVGGKLDEWFSGSDEAASRIEEFDNALASLLDQDFETGRVSFDALQEELAGAGVTAEQFAAAFPNATRAMRDGRELAGEVVGILPTVRSHLQELTSDGVEPATEAQEGLNEEYETAVENLDKAIGKIDEYLGKIQSGTELEIAWHESIRNLTSTVQENGLGWDYLNERLAINTKAGAENWKMMEGAADQVYAYGNQILSAAQDTDAASSAALQYAANLRGQLQMLGYNDQMIDEMFRSLGLMPDQITTWYNSPGLLEAINNTATLDSMIRNLPTHVSTIFTGAVDSLLDGFAGRPVKKRARGGAFGAGDTVLLGEEGPELVRFGQSGMVTDADRTAAALSGGGGAMAPIVIQFNVDGREFVRKVVEPHLIQSGRARNGRKGVGS